MIHDKLIRVAAVVEQTGMSRSSIDRLEKAGQFPKRVQISTRAIGWYEAAVMDWVENRQTKNMLVNTNSKVKRTKI